MSIPSNFSLSRAQACAEASALAYQSATIESQLAHFLILERDGYNIVASRGTANFRDALTDASCWRDGEIHAGFKRSFDSVAEPLGAAIAKLDESPILFCGHSLGGGDAVLAAFRFARPQDSIYTFGQPRVGSAFFAAMCEKSFAGRHFRFVNQEDIVPRIPLWLAGYRHSGQEIFFPSIGCMRFGAPLWLKLASDIYGTYLAYRRNYEIAQLTDHGIAQYVAKLHAAQPEKNVPASLTETILTKP